ncbi:MAG: ATP-binding protein [Planctomycetes bacterium]|nr:ATP-binding protein [Planctomycetota bacterium]
MPQLGQQAEVVLARYALRAAAEGSIEVSLGQLLEETNLASEIGLLEGAGRIATFFEQVECELVPSVLSGNESTTRILRKSKGTREGDAKRFGDEIERGEHTEQEFKSTLLFDLKKQVHKPGLDGAEYRSDAVLFAALKTVAAFLNVRGGVLFIGVADDGTPTGIEADFGLLKKQQNIDGWELELRNQVEAHFFDGRKVSNYLSVTYATLGGKRVARVQVAPRKALSCVRKSSTDNYQVYARQGNSSKEIPIEYLEEFVLERHQ